MTEKFLAYIRYKARCRELKYEPVDYETWAAQSIARGCAWLTGCGDSDGY